MSPGPRAAYIEGLRQLAAVLEAHPEVPLPYEGRVSALTFHYLGAEDARAEMAAAVKAFPCTWEKHVRDYADASYLDLRGQLAGLRIELTAYRDSVCTRRVVGVQEQEVKEVVIPAVTRTVTKPVEIVEWDCGPILRPATNCPICGGHLEPDGSHVCPGSGARIPPPARPGAGHEPAPEATP